MVAVLLRRLRLRLRLLLLLLLPTTGAMAALAGLR